MRLTRASALAVLLAGLALACSGAGTAEARKAPAGLLTGLDDFAFQEPQTQGLALQRAKSARASIVRIVLTWASAEPTAPPSSAQARDPNWSGYNWSQFDAAVQGARGRGSSRAADPRRPGVG